MSSKGKGKGYRDSLNLPKTKFSMKANLTQNEPIRRKKWAKQNIYQQVLDSRKDCPQYILHDGPPYANGDIHMGHVINKVLKDIVVKYKTMTGHQCPYVPGWDCHGLPIEVKVMAELGEEAQKLTKPEIRKKCQKYASKFVKVQSKQFMSLGIFGDFDNPYLTLKPQYEKSILNVFAELVGNGLVYKQLKPIHWSVGCQTALADAELEYKDIESPSIYVNFPADETSAEKLAQLGLVEDTASKVSFMIWTTTPWTLAANLAVAVHPSLDYVGLEYNKNGQKFTSVICAERLEAITAEAGLEKGTYKTTGKVKGAELQGLRYNHPFIDKNPTDKDAYFVVTADYVTTEDGTGLVHTAPGHGVEDYITGQNHNLAVYSPVDDKGCYDQTVPEWLTGLSVLDVDPKVNARLNELGLLVAEKSIAHSYPHCWRSKMPVIFRATEQWFISVDRQLPSTGKSLRQMALEQISDVRWIPAWGEKRIRGMLESRPDWCISRQRSWGLAIPSFVTSDGKSLLTKESVQAVAEHIGNNGSNSWFTDSPQEILGPDFQLPDGFSFDDLQKEENIFDVWFESGCSWHAVAVEAGWHVPVDIYLEGSDQHRGWFQLSLLPALGATGKPPFKTVLTHGFTVDEKGMKQSKSAGNYVSALDEINKYGSDILRLWVASVNYQEDMRCSDELIGRLQDAYRKIRNTLRYLLGNTSDFEPESQTVAYDDMLEIDKWAVAQLQKLIESVHQAYEAFAFHRVFALLYNFCTVEMSSIYLDVLKDRLYCDAQNSRSRKSAQTAMTRILEAVVKMIAPILVHSADEAWEAIETKTADAPETIHLADMPTPDESIDYQSQQPRWDKLMEVRDEVLKQLESLRQNQVINSNQQADVKVACPDETYKIITDFGIENFANLCIVSNVNLEKADQLNVTAAKCTFEKCQRCWNFYPSVGSIENQPDLCKRCAEVMDAG
jgi:isoleucyl-tRNA synthetase